jgi:hypothetical protein
VGLLDFQRNTLYPRMRLHHLHRYFICDMLEQLTGGSFHYFFYLPAQRGTV